MRLADPATENLATTTAAKYQQPRKIIREAILTKMDLLYTTSLEPFLGTYHIVGDSKSTLEPGSPSSPCSLDLRDGVLTLTRPEPSHSWPKEPSPKHTHGWSQEQGCVPSGVVLHLYDRFLGADHSASLLTPATDVSPPSASSSSFSSSSSSSKSSPTSSSSQLIKSGTRRWRLNWDPSFPRLGYQYEGMDATTTWGHTLSFSEIRDDRGHPFAILELRPAGSPKNDPDPSYITVLAKRQRDRYGREGLTEKERARLGWRDV
ncbi:hypothetical protein C8Q76DRAFT_790232 [Earliella scabrosa]|nr:hypothetical protein C8Q76DRAFT_790232 [Earliella scabrosa]